MIDYNYIFNHIKINYWVPLMNENYNQLSSLPVMIKCNIMIMLAIMWGLLFYFTAVWTIFFPYWSFGLFFNSVLGAAITMWTFKNANKIGYAELYHSK